MVERKTSANKVLPKAGLNGFDWACVQGSTSVLRLNFSAKIPAFGNTQTFIGPFKGDQHETEMTTLNNIEKLALTADINDKVVNESNLLDDKTNQAFKDLSKYTKALLKKESKMTSYSVDSLKSGFSA